METTDEEIRVGLVGLGGLGRRLGRQFAGLPGGDLVAITDVDPEAAAAAGRELDVPPGSRYAEYGAMLDGERLDAVAVATPNGLHYEQTLAALDRGLHVLCEKPLATSVRDAYDLTRRVESVDEVVMVGYQRHLNPAYDLARERWALGDREPTFVTGEITQDWRSYFETMDDWRMDPELGGGGHLLNVGTHVIDAILWTTGLIPTHVTARVDFHDDEEIFDRQSAVVVEFDNGAFATVSDTGLAARTREHIHVWDGEGAVYLEGREWDDRTGHVIDADGTERSPYHGHRRPFGKAGAFLKSVRSGERPPATVRDGLKATVVTLAAYEAGRRNERVELTDLYPFVDAELLE